MKRTVVLSLTLFLLAPLFIKCSSHSENTSFISVLDSIDAYISNDDVKSALKTLKNAEDRAYSVYDRLGVYRRYILLGEEISAEEFLKKSIKVFPDNKELAAVYVELLLTQNRLDEAYAVSETLKNTEFASFYSECRLKTLLAQNDSALFRDADLTETYLGAWTGTSDTAWLRNAVCLIAEKGDFTGAASYYPGSVSTEPDVMMWACLFYDAGLFKESLDCLLSDVKFENNSLELERLSLEADCFYVLDEEESAEDVRKTIVSKIEAEPPEISVSRKFLPQLFVNRSLYAERMQNAQLRLESLLYAADNYPYYEPALALYVKAALETHYAADENEIDSELRAHGLRTLSMEERDRLPLITPDDAFLRLELAFENTHSSDFSVLKEQLTNLLSKGESSYVRNARLWSYLEKQRYSSGVYSGRIMEYALSQMLSDGYEKEASGLFYDYVSSAHGTEFSFTENKENLPLWEIQFAAYFEAAKGHADTALELYGFIAKNYSEHLPFVAGKNAAVVNACVNLAVIYEGTFRESLALEYLNKASQICGSAQTKAEILYRMAKLSEGTGDRRNALREPRYALELNPDHRKARLFLKSIQ